ncbi:phosphatidylserine decarboxylase family protein [Marinilabiliaceae bacterium JC040]|nr:phosphatidylserine decarboxylase family protein [Marinilabiliaceae bacterium JC040]
MRLHKAGHKLLIKILLVLAALNLCVYYIIDNETVFNIVLGITSIFYVLVINFFRSPYREVKVSDDKIIAPADGKIVVIEETTENEYLKEKCIQVSIFMNVFNVHINWFPTNGIIKYYKHHSGRFLAAYLPKSSTENERSTVVVERPDGKQILFRQIAGALARRIVTYAKVGEKITQANQCGFIKFGSRVDIYLPLGTQIDVELNQKVVGSQTVIATIKK